MPDSAPPRQTSRARAGYWVLGGTAALLLIYSFWPAPAPATRRSAQLSPDAEVEASVRAPARSELVIRVFADARALAGATTTLSSASGEALRRGPTGPDGSVRFSGLNAGDYALVVEHPDFVVHQRKLVLEDASLTVQVLLAKAAAPLASSSARSSRSVSGRVISQTGDPIAGASVGSGAPGSDFATTDQDGAFVLSGVGDSPIQVFATAPGYAAKHRRGVAPDSQDVTLELEPPASVRGALEWPSGAERIDVSVCHHDEFFRREICIARRTYRPPTVSYEISSLPSGDYELVAEAEGHAPRRFPLRLSAGADLAGPRVELLR